MHNNVNYFIDFYSRMYDSEYFIDDARILRVRFEDFVYNYSEMVCMIEQFIGKENLGEHKYSKEFFNPEISIKNTQLFTINEEWAKEAKIIENSKLASHLYDFPYINKTSMDEITDPNPDTSKKNKEITSSGR